MGVYVSIRGWIEMWDEMRPLVRDLIQRDEDHIRGYANSWCFPEEGGGLSRFAFYGCTVREIAVDDVRAQVRRIAETVSVADGEYTDFPEGDFLVEHESHESNPEQHPLIRWRFADGVFREYFERPI